jgi:uncharacterized protein
MTHTVVGLCTIELHLPGVRSLKEKRSILKSMLARMHNTFNVSAAEVGRNDAWQSAIIAFASVSNADAHANQVIAKTLDWIESNFPNVLIVEHEVEIL